MPPVKPLTNPVEPIVHAHSVLVLSPLSIAEQRRRKAFPDASRDSLFCAAANSEQHNATIKTGHRLFMGAIVPLRNQEFKHALVPSGPVRSGQLSRQPKSGNAIASHRME